MVLSVLFEYNDGSSYHQASEGNIRLEKEFPVSDLRVLQGMKIHDSCNESRGTQQAGRQRLGLWPFTSHLIQVSYNIPNLYGIPYIEGEKLAWARSHRPIQSIYHKFSAGSL